ncbi:MAG: hypothetical protein HKN82_17815 [Akkermansiaceae bacterium]|nr:hypothetical protein [Akkermansiaceae bacterium]NNM28772.1 hypothetical protein [Akkermansiaceae bacterium]
MEKYKSKVADEPAVEMIHVSLDRDDSVAESWAASVGMPWPTVMRDKLERSGLSEYSPRGIPHYLLVDAAGNKLAEGSAAVFAKVDELKEGS